MAIYHRDVHAGDGQEVDLALYESLFRLIETIVPAYDQLGAVAERRGNALGVASPVGTFATRDGGWIVLTASTDRTFARFCEVIGKPDLPTEPRFSSNELRVQHNEELEPLVAAWFAAHDRDDAIRQLDEAGVPISPLMSIADIFVDPHYRDRGNLIEVDHPTLGTVTMPGIVPHFSQTPGAVRHAGANELGAFNAEIYGDVLGLSDDELRQLRDDGVI
jgi:formyl-CoA transferase